MIQKLAEKLFGAFFFRVGKQRLGFALLDDHALVEKHHAIGHGLGKTQLNLAFCFEALLSNRNAILAEHRAMDGAPNGLGDLFSALLLARFLEKLDEEKALQLATASVYEILARSMKRQRSSQRGLPTGGA